jgi:signal transduction histidine kinase
MQMQNEFGTLEDKDIAQFTQSIIDNTQYLSTIIDDFRNFYKPNKEKEYFNMKDIMKINLELLSGSFRNNDIEIIEEFEDIKIYSYKNELIQVVINLLNNARDAIILQELKHPKYIFVKCYSHENKIIVTITDNAKGIKQEIKCKIFDPYFTTKHQFQGTGLGLYMSKKIINESLMGQLFVENVEYSYNANQYAGAMFTITLPLS